MMLVPAGERRIGSLPRGIPIANDESFPSYIDRVAATYDVTLGRLMRQFDRNDGTRGMLAGYGVTETPARIPRISALFRLRPTSIERMLVTHYAGGVIPCKPLDTTRPHDVIHRLQTHWVYLRHSHFCPLCLAEREGAWKLAWQLSWSFACTRHKCLLIDRCPSCGHWPRSGGPLVRIPNFRELVPIPGTCFNSGPRDPGGRRANRKPCLHDLAEVPVTTIWDSLLSIQRHIDTMIDANDRQRAAPFFADLRALSALLLGFGEHDDFRPVPGAIHETLERALSARSVARAEAQAKLADGVLTRYNPFQTTPQSAPLMAAVATSAVELLNAPDAELATRLAPLARRLQHHSRSAAQVALRYAASPRLGAALIDARDITVSFARRSRYPARTRPDPQDPAAAATAPERLPPLEARHVPQLLWREEYEARFASLFADVSATQGRGFCSICLAKLVGGLSWLETCDLLDLHGAHFSMVYRVQRQLSESGGTEPFHRCLHALASDLGQRADLVDYAARRRALSRYITVADDDWTSICQLSGIRRTTTGGRRRYSAVWLWAEHTSGDPLRAPAMQSGGRTAYVRQQWRRFLRDDGPRMEPALRLIANDLVA